MHFLRTRRALARLHLRLTLSDARATRDELQKALDSNDLEAASEHAIWLESLGRTAEKLQGRLKRLAQTDGPNEELWLFTIFTVLLCALLAGCGGGAAEPEEQRDQRHPPTHCTEGRCL